MSRKSSVAVVVAALVSSALLPGCANPDNNKWLGAGIGAGGGAVAGRAIAGKGHGLAGAVIGGVVGGVAGYAIAGGFGSKATTEQKADPKYQRANQEFDAGVQAKQSGNDQAALQHYQAATRLAPEQPEPYNNAGLIYLGQNDRVNAEANFRLALQADPSYQPAKDNLTKMGLTP